MISKTRHLLLALGLGFGLPLVTAAPLAADPIKSFKQLCMAHAPNVDALSRAARRQGFEIVPLSLNSFMGLRDRTDETLRVNVGNESGFECSITTSGDGDSYGAQMRFFQALGTSGHSGKGAGELRGQYYEFLFESAGGDRMILRAR